MRFAVVLALAACGEKTDHKPAAAPAVADDDERCDPKETKVCSGSRVVACENGVIGRGLRTCHHGCRKGKCIGACGDGAELIYVVDHDANLLSFDPRLLSDPFTLIGRMSCNAVGSPFSMSVDRSGTAWVVYTDGSLFEVSTRDATCKPSGYVTGSSGSPTFGMGFVTDEPGGETEKLYIAANNGTHGLSYIDTTRDVPIAHEVGTIQGTVRANAELTGTSEAKLFGFYPVDGGKSFVQEIDRATGAAVGQRWELGDPLEFVDAYAFAQWGGVFYMFVSSTRNTVRAIDRRTGAYKMVMDDIPWRITGAGVSTCAPERDQASGRP